MSLGSRFQRAPRRRAHAPHPTLALALLAAPFAAQAAPSCADVLARLGNRLVDATCVASPDLTTANPATTPADNSNPVLPLGAWTPTTDRAVIAPGPGKRTPITKM